MLRAPLITICVGLLLIFSSKAKTNGKDKKSKQVVPDVKCNVRAGNINFPEFIVRCPSNCHETKEKVYGTDTFASISSICNAAIHNGIITNSGGKVIVKKMAGLEMYKGSFAHGIRSLSLPKWRESFTVSVGKPKKGVIYPSTLEYKTSSQTKPTIPTTKTSGTTTSAPMTTTLEPTTTTTTPPPTTSTTTTTTTAKPRPVHVRDADLSNSETDTGYTWSNGGTVDSAAPDPRPDISEYERWYYNGQYPSRTTDTESGPKHPPETRTRVETVEMEKPEWKPFDLDEVPDPLPGAQGDPNCKVDIAFLMDGSWSIGKRRFKIQKDFLAEVSQVINVGISGPMMGIIQYGDDPVTEFGLRQFSSSKDLKPAIDKIVQKGGLSNVGKALSYINKHFFSDANGNRGGAPNVAVVLVDGWPTDKVEEASRLARESGINIFFVTIEGPDDSEKHNVVEANFVDKAVCRTNGFYSLPVASWFALRKAAQPLVKRLCDTDRLLCSKTCLNANDIAFVIDGSSSVGTGNFRTVLQFVANVSREFEISDTDTRIGAVQYTYEQRLEFAFGQHNTKTDVLNAIRRINYWSGGTSTGAAITYAAEKLFSKSKPNKRKIMIVITDGRSYDDVRAPALAVHRSGVIAYSVGIAWAAQDELEYIATDPDKDHSFFVDEFDNLYKYVPKIINNICHEFNSQPRN
ncbi:vitrin isoform 5-T5 [Clarias gariepinus]|uniref:vitrin isoform X5 n=1 Tax=Clarias gariepinus TaxID=13013 RepID=UPI00234D5682|nr:vitrin isoform X5 [Clarias gariepinus]